MDWRVTRGRQMGRVPDKVGWKMVEDARMMGKSELEAVTLLRDEFLGSHG